MIKIVDDRQKRQLIALNNNSFETIKDIHVCNPKEVYDFIPVLQDKKIIPFLKDVKILCLHESSLFSGFYEGKDIIEEECAKQNIPIIYFSGGYSLCSTVKFQEIYTANVSEFYSRVLAFEISENENFDPNFFLFGNKYILSKLLELRRKVKLYSSVDEILDFEGSLGSEEVEAVFLEFKQLDKFNKENALQILNQKIKTLL